MKFEMNSKNISINVEMINGDFEVIGEERNDIELDFGDLRKNAADEIFEISFENEILKISQKIKKLSRFTGGEDYSVKVMLPKSSIITTEVNNISGDIKISEIESLKGVIKSKSGDVVVSDIAQFDAELTSISGEVNVVNANGMIKASTISGDISLTDSEYSKIVVKSVSGDINLSCAFNLQEDAIISSVSGDLSVNFIQYSGEKDIVLKTVSGDVDLKGEKPQDEKIKISQVKGDFANFNPIGKDFFNGSFGSMLKNLKHHIKNVSKEVAGNRFTSEVREPNKDDQNIQMILKMVSEGKISADEAEKLISALK